VSFNLTLIGIVFLILVPLFGGVSYYLGKRKTSTPIMVGVMGGFLALIPMLGIIFIAVLVFKNDLPTNEA
jgi:uncharacterized membrane protein